MNRRLLSLAVSFLLPACALLAQKEEAPAAPARVHVIGASVSGGFEDGPLFGAEVQADSVTVHEVLKRWAGGEVRVSTHLPLEMCGLFRDPMTIGAKMVDVAKRRKADVLVAIDFPFWFGYGYVGSDEQADRMQRFERCLELLASFDVPILVGDLPDMTGATPRLLSPRQIPSPDVLKALNARLHAWAAEHDNVTLVPLAETVQQMKTDGVALPLQAGARKTAPGALLQGDRLHATRLGVAYLVYRLQEPLRALFPAGHPLHEQRWSFDQFVKAAGAEEALEDVLAKAAAEEREREAAKERR